MGYSRLIGRENMPEKEVRYWPLQYVIKGYISLKTDVVSKLHGSLLSKVIWNGAFIGGPYPINHKDNRSKRIFYPCELLYCLCRLRSI
jgi:hypothetical protein